MELGDGHDDGLELHQLLLGDIHQRCIGAHPGGAGGGVHREDALAGVEPVAGVPLTRQESGLNPPQNDG